MHSNLHGQDQKKTRYWGDDMDLEEGDPVIDMCRTFEIIDSRQWHFVEDHDLENIHNGVESRPIKRLLV
mgnify:CR=1 FL=1